MHFRRVATVFAAFGAKRYQKIAHHHGELVDNNVSQFCGVLESQLSAFAGRKRTLTICWAQ
jgi:hypothetical protein